MPHVSKKQLEGKVFIRMCDRLAQVFFSALSKKDADLLLRDLLTKTERVMLAKRLAIIFMFAEGVSVRRISSALQVSTSTTIRIARSFDRGAYPYIAALLGKKKSKEAVRSQVEKLIRFGVLSQGRRRWEWLNNMKE
ncbi:MAG: helix-turn-helix domain-containing protein [Patescibacteria group bacterium]